MKVAEQFRLRTRRIVEIALYATTRIPIRFPRESAALASFNRGLPRNHGNGSYSSSVGDECRIGRSWDMGVPESSK